MATGKVKWFNNVKKYGFIQADDGNEYFVHFSDILSEGYKTLRKNQRVDFDVEAGPRGDKAVRVKKQDEPERGPRTVLDTEKHRDDTGKLDVQEQRNDKVA